MLEKHIVSLLASATRLKEQNKEYSMIRRDHADFIGVPCFYEGQRVPLSEVPYEPKPGSISMVKVRVYDLYATLKKGEIHGIDWEDPNQGQGGDSESDLD